MQGIREWLIGAPYQGHLMKYLPDSTADRAP